MHEFLANNADLLVNIGVLGSFIGSILLWSHRRLRADMNEFKSDINEFKEEMKVVNTRLDATNMRIDKAYSLILDMMKEIKAQSSKSNT